MNAPIGIAGSGAFGHALAAAVARTGRAVVYWNARASDRKDEGIEHTRDLAELAKGELIFIALPAGDMIAFSRSLGGHLNGAHLVVHAARNLVGDQLIPLSRILREATPVRRIGALGGPLTTQYLERGEPLAMVVGSRFPEVGDAVSAALASAALDVQCIDDTVGVEVASAVSRVVAIATGMTLGLKLGPSAIATMVTVGVKEARQLGVALGASERTFWGRAAITDMASATIDGRDEVKWGATLAKEAATHTEGPTKTPARPKTQPEGVALARRILSFGQRQGIDTPIARSVVAAVEDPRATEEAIRQVLAHPSSLG